MEYLKTRRNFTINTNHFSSHRDIFHLIKFILSLKYIIHGKPRRDDHFSTETEMTLFNVNTGFSETFIVRPPEFPAGNRGAANTIRNVIHINGLPYFPDDTFHQHIIPHTEVAKKLTERLTHFGFHWDRDIVAHKNGYGAQQLLNHTFTPNVDLASLNVPTFDNIVDPTKQWRSFNYNMIAENAVCKYHTENTADPRCTKAEAEVFHAYCNNYLKGRHPLQLI
jgi:hypothetical protein